MQRYTFFYKKTILSSFICEIFNLNSTLQAQYTLQALREAIKQAQSYDLSKLIHHSDRGVQYCCNDYINELNSYIHF